MSILIYNIKELVGIEEKPRLMAAGKEMSKLNTIRDAWILIEEERIKDFGRMADLEKNYELRITNYEERRNDNSSSHQHISTSAHQLIDASGRMVRTLTSNTGGFSLTNLPAGIYLCTVTFSGTSTESISRNSGGSWASERLRANTRYLPSGAQTAFVWT